MICSLKFKKVVVILKMLLDFVLLILKLWSIQVVISLPLWMKFTIGQLLLSFLCNFSTFFSYIGGILVTNHFSLVLIDRYILAIQQTITHKEHLRYSFWSAAIFWTASEALGPWSEQQRVAKTALKSFWLSSSSQKSSFLTVLMYALYDHPRYSKVKRKYQQYGQCCQTTVLFVITIVFFIRNKCTQSWKKYRHSKSTEQIYQNREMYNLSKEKFFPIR